MSLIHRTNHWGHTIYAEALDDDVNFDAIWTQFCFRDGGCCRGFGERSVMVDNDDLIDVHGGDWNLFLVNEHPGRHDEHYFYKFALIPCGTHRYGKRSCERRGWDFVGTVDAYNAMEDLTNYLLPYYEGQMCDDSYVETYHVHLGIMMDELHT
jgi:hypothetical protein